MSYAAESTTPISTARPCWRPVLVGAAIAAAAFTLTTARGTADPELALLLRFMAIVKAAMAMGVTALVAWRLRGPVPLGAGVGYVMAASSMAAGAGLIWQLEHVAAGAALVHGGFAALAGFGWLDRTAWAQAISVRAASMRSKRSN